MLDRIKNSLCIFALIAFSVGFLKGIALSEWLYFLFNATMFGFALIWSFGQIILHKIQIKSFLLHMIVDFLLSITMLFLYGYAVGWYSGLNDVWYVCAVALMVYIIAYFLGIHTIKRDLTIINQKLRERKQTNTEL